MRPMNTFRLRLTSVKSARAIVSAVIVGAALLVVVALAGRGLQSGTSEIAFLRGGQLLTMRSDGSGVREIAAANVAGFAWSPDHHSIVFRALRRAPANQTALPTPDATGLIEAASVNGGFPLQISPDNPGFLLSDAWWDHDGNRVIYRETSPAAPDSPLYVVSQTDQPVGIARRLVTNSVGMPALAADGQHVAAIDATGDLLISPPGASGVVLAHGALTALASGRPARLLWRPGHSEVLFATPGARSMVNLVLTDTRSQTVLTSVSDLVDDAFSPDGSWLLVRTVRQFALYSVDAPGTAVFTWPDGDQAALPWWSPDSKTLLIQNASGWTRVDGTAKKLDTLLRDTGASRQAGHAPKTWSPATNSPWSPDGRSIAIIADAGSRWLGNALPAPRDAAQGIYVASIGPNSADPALLIASGSVDGLSWGFADPSTVFLVGASS